MSPLDRLTIATPCTAQQALESDGPVRYCATCDKSVYDLSAMSRDAAERVVGELEAVRQPGGRSCRGRW